MSRAIPLFGAMQKKLDRINLVMRETLSGVRVIRAFVRTEHEEQRFDEATLDLMDTGLRVNRLFAITMPALMAIMNLSTVAVLWLGAYRVDSGEMPIGNLTAFLQYIIQILFAIMMAVIMFIMVPRAAVSGAGSRRSWTPSPPISDPPTPISPARSGPRRVPRRGVPLPGRGGAGPARDQLRGEPGRDDRHRRVHGQRQVHAVNLLPRFYDASNGAVLVDGVDVREMDRQDLWTPDRHHAAAGLPVRGTIATNIRYGDAAGDRRGRCGRPSTSPRAATSSRRWRTASRRRSPRAAPTSRAASGSGSRSPVPSRRSPTIYVFDDSFSALDFRTDARLRAALARELSHATVIIVAQRVGTILHADRIVVLEDGGIAGIGTHDELMKSCETYREIVLSQVDRGGGRMSGPMGRPGGTAGPRAPVAIAASAPSAPAPARPGQRPPPHMAAQDDARLMPDGQVERLPGLVPAAAGASSAPSGHAGRSSSLGVISVSFAILGPKILGNATNMIFEGVVGKPDPGRPHGPPDRRRPPRAGPDQLRRHAGGDAQRRPGRRHRLREPARDPASLAPHLPRQLAVRLGPAYIMAGVTQRTVYRLRERSTRSSAGCRSPTSTASPRGDILSRVTNDIDNISQTLQQSLTQLITSLLTVIGVLVMMLTISPLLALISLLVVPASMVVTILIASGPRCSSPPSGSGPATSTATSRRCTPATRSSRCSGTRRTPSRSSTQRNDELYQASYRAQFMSGHDPAGDDVHLEPQLRAIAVIGGIQVANGR